MADFCFMPNCTEPQHSRGFCQQHNWDYSRHLLGGTYSGRGEALHWLRAHIDHKGNDCLIWPFHRDRQGYGRMTRANGLSALAHRRMAILAHGEPPTALHQAAHCCNCGHLGCVNPKHLAWKTQAENAADRILAGTANRGERHNHARLTEMAVQDIRKRLAAGVGFQHLGNDYGVHEQTIRDISNGKTWGWLATG